MHTMSMPTYGLLTPIRYGIRSWFRYIGELSEATLTVSDISDYLVLLRLPRTARTKKEAAANLSPIWYLTECRIQHHMTRTYIAPIALTSHPLRLHRTHHVYRSYFDWIWAKFLLGTPSLRPRISIALTSHLHHTNITLTPTTPTLTPRTPTLIKNTIENYVFPHFPCPIWSFPVTSYRMPYRIGVRKA